METVCGRRVSRRGRDVDAFAVEEYSQIKSYDIEISTPELWEG